MMINKIDIDTINQLYLTNKKYFIDLQNHINDKINGRVCHNKVMVLHLLVKFFANINTYLEVGVHNGASMSYVVSTNKSLSCYGIDLFESSIGHYKKDKITLNKTKNNIQKNNHSKSIIQLIKGNSHSADTINHLKQMLGSKQADLLLIDADHSFEGIKKDFEIYSKLVSLNGIIVLDDYAKKWPGIIQFVETINRSEFEIIGTFLNNELILQKIK